VKKLCVVRSMRPDMLMPYVALLSKKLAKLD
jgi:hypothetical protein